jgi:HAND
LSKALEDKFNLNNVSLTDQDDRQQSTGMYIFEGQEYKKAVQPEPAENSALDFIDIGQRERKVNISYDIDRYYREALTTNPNSSSNPQNPKKKLKGWRLICNGGYDHQFFDGAKLDALEEKETKWNLY